MSTTETEGASALESYVPFTPFQDSYAFEPEAAAVAEADRFEASPAVTPFVSEYVGAEPELTPEAAELHQLLFDLYDRELDETLEEIAQEAWSAANDRAQTLGETVGGETAEQFLDQWIAPLRDQAEAMLDSIAETASRADLASMSETELDRFVDQFEPEATGLEQYFEDFLKGLAKKAGKLVKSVATIAKKGLTMLPGIGLILGKLKALVGPLLNRVLKMALDKLPPKLRPAARQLAQKLLGKVVKEAEEEDEDTETAETTPNASAIQQQFDLDVASLPFAADLEQDLIATEAATEAERVDEATIAQLHEARARFVDELERGVDPQQALESFIPAILPIARTAIGIIGRPRVVSFLAGFLAKLIGKYVPPEMAKQLSQAIVDAGLRMMTLEAPTEAEVQALAPDALAATVEDTVLRLAELDEATFEQPELLEAATVAAFHEAAAENFPSELLVPDLHEASHPGAWVSMPLGRKRRKYYRRYTRSFEVVITPQIAASLKTFGGATVAQFLKDRFGITGPVRARVHLYRATTGTTPARIARLERGVRGLGTAGRPAWTQLHPLSPAAAGTLFQQPGLGRAMPRAYTASRGRIGVGQRLYYLELPDVGTAPTPVKRSSEVNVTLDFPKDEFRVFVYFGEADAQQIASRLRKKDVTAAILASRKVYEAGVASALGGDIRRHVKIMTESLPQEEFVGKLVKRLTRRLKRLLAKRVAAWVGMGIAAHVAAKAGEFVAATESPAEGATMVITIVNPPGAPLVRKVLRGEGIGSDALRGLSSAFKGDPKIAVASVSGFRFD